MLMELQARSGAQMAACTQTAASIFTWSAISWWVADPAPIIPFLLMQPWKGGYVSSESELGALKLVGSSIAMHTHHLPFPLTLCTSTSCYRSSPHTPAFLPISQASLMSEAAVHPLA